MWKISCIALLTAVHVGSVGIDPIRVDKHALREWVNAHEQSVRPAASWLHEKIRIINLYDVYGSLELHFERFLKKNNPKKIVFLRPLKHPMYTNSADWLIGHIKSKFPQFKHAPVITSREAFLHRSSSTHFVYIDDGSFSGTQIRDNLTNYPNTTVMLTSASDRAIATIKRVNPHAETFFAIKAPTISQLLNKEDLVVRKRVLFGLKKMVDSGKTGLQDIHHLLSLPLTGFEHGIPDGYSFPQFLLDGIVSTPLLNSSKESRINFFKGKARPYVTQRDKLQP